MTCLVAWRGHDATMIGTDSQWTQGYRRGSIGVGKLWRNGRFVIAIAGNLRSMQVLQHGPQFDSKVPDRQIVQHLITDWVPKIFTQLNDTGMLIKNEDKLAQIEVSGIIVSRKKIITMGGDLSIIEEPGHYAAEGSGDMAALGYMAGHRRSDCAYQVVMGALKASEKHCSGVSGPFYTEVVQ